MLRFALLAGILLAAGWVQAEDDLKFVAADIYLDSAEPVAAWQFELSDKHGVMQVVGVERGESDAYARTPYYDREAVRLGQADRIVVADYSLAEVADLPHGRIRIATIHLMLERGTGDDTILQLITATTPDGKIIDASVELVLQIGSDQ